MGTITIVGLGPGPFGLITMETWDKMQQAEQLLLRTAVHPTVAELEKRGLQFSSYDNMYETGATFEEVYIRIAADVVRRAREGQHIVYAVPGSPLVAERTVIMIRELAHSEGQTIHILPGMSFAEVLYVRLGIDPIEGLTILDAADLSALPEDMPTALVVTQVYNQQVASEAKLSLMEIYPDDHQVMLVRNLGLEDEQILSLPLYEIDRQRGIDHLTSLYVPAAPVKTREFTLEPLTDIMGRLRAPDGRPWDILQTHASLRSNLVEEVYEVIEAIDLEDDELLCEELGDLLLQIIFHARMAEESGSFSMQDVIDGICSKLIRRHPHVFGQISVRDAGEVILNWEQIKKEEKKERKSLLDGVPKDLPALMGACKLQQKAAKAGFDWDDIEPVWGKLDEEIAELKQAIQQQDSAHTEEELGDVLFSVVNLARFLKVDAETALRLTNGKFKQRFSHVEARVKASGHSWNEFTLEELDAFWEEAKR